MKGASQGSRVGRIMRAVAGFALAAPRALVERGIIPNFNPRWLFCGIGALFLAVGSASTFLAQPSPLPLGGSWWLKMRSPLETAPYKRLTFISAGLKVLNVADDEATIWALGDNGLALRSIDRGRSWNWIRVDGATNTNTGVPGPEESKPPPAAPSSPAAETDIFTNTNIGAVDSQPKVPTTFALTSPANITQLVTYHWNGGRGSPPGTIGLRSQSGQLYGPYRARATSGQNNAPNVNWIADIPGGLRLAAGTYTVIDSDNATWSHNLQSGVSGFATVRGTLEPPSAQFQNAQAVAQQTPIAGYPSVFQATQSAQQSAGSVPPAQSLFAPNFVFACHFSGASELEAVSTNVLAAIWHFDSGSGLLSVALTPESLGAASIIGGSCVSQASVNRGVIIGGMFDPLERAPDNDNQSILMIDNALGRSVFRSRDTRLEHTFPSNRPATGGFIRADDSSLWMVTANGGISRAQDDTRSWSDPVPVMNAGGEVEIRAFNAIYFTEDGATGWIVGGEGIVYRSDDRGASWIQIASLPDGRALHAVQFLSDGETGWAVGDGGLYGTDDGGTTWSPVAINTDDLANWPGTPIIDLELSNNTLQQCVAAPSPSSGANASTTTTSGTGNPTSTTTTTTSDSDIVCSADTTTNFLFPAPLALLAFLSAFVTLTFAGFAPDRFVEEDDKKEALEQGGGAAAYASDRPLRQGEYDLLNLGNIAEGLAEFLVNRRTEPPLSLAVDGPWGSGKSSLLNLFVEGEAPQRRFRVVWFNAWHHEKEENTLGAILEMICREAIPPFLSPFGFIMRANLLRTRIIEKPVSHLAGAALVVFLLAAAYINPQIPAEVLHGGSEVVTRILQNLDLIDMPEEVNPEANVETIARYIPLLSGVIGALYLMFNLQTKLLALAKTAEGAMPRIVLTRERKTLMTDVGLRTRFAREFAAVTKAMRPMRLVIVLDDLDRCQPAKVAEILQLVNFLMTSGECFVIVAADLRFIEACVREEYRNVAGLLVGDDDDAQDKEAVERNLDEFAHRYLRKIVNVVVRVPRMTAEQSRTFVNEDAITKLRNERGAEKGSAWSAAKRYGVWGGWLAVIAAALVLPLLIADTFVPRPTVVSAPRVGEQAQTPPTTNPGAARPVAGTAFGGASAGQQKDDQKPLQVQPGAPTGPANPWWFLLPIAILAFFGSVAWQIWSIVEATRKTDAKSFTQALMRWVPLVYARSPMPRDIRRFTNQARYLASQNRHSGRGKLNDDQLVKYAAFEFIDENWFEDLSQASFMLIERFAKAGSRDSLPSNWPETLKQAVIDAFAVVPSAGSDTSGSIDEYRRLASGGTSPEPKPAA